MTHSLARRLSELRLRRTFPPLAVTMLVGAALTGCGGGSAVAGGTAGASGTTSAAVSSAAGSASATQAPSASAGAGSGSAVGDPCSLLPAGQAQAVLHRALGPGRKVTTGDLTECAYTTGGTVIVAVLGSSFTAASFRSFVHSQDGGPYASTTGTSSPLPGVGDAAYAYPKVGIVEALHHSTVISITTGDQATSIQIAKLVLARLP